MGLLKDWGPLGWNRLNSSAGILNAEKDDIENQGLNLKVHKSKFNTIEYFEDNIIIDQLANHGFLKINRNIHCLNKSRTEIYIELPFHKEFDFEDEDTIEL